MNVKTSFSKKRLDFFPEISIKDVKLMLLKVLKVWRRYLPPCLRNRKNPAGGGAESVHHSGAHKRKAVVWLTISLKKIVKDVYRKQNSTLHGEFGRKRIVKNELIPF